MNNFKNNLFLPRTTVRGFKKRAVARCQKKLFLFVV